MAELLAADRQQLVRVLQDLDEFANERNRRSFLQNSELQGIVSKVDLEGAAATVLTRLVIFLEKRGYLDEQNQALGLFLQAIRPILGREQYPFLDRLLNQYHLLEPLDADASVSQTTPVAVTKAASDPLQLTRLLLACPSMSTAGGRSGVVGLLPDGIKHSISLGATSNSTQEVLSIVQACLNYPAGLDALVGCIRFFDGGSIPFSRLENYLNNL